MTVPGDGRRLHADGVPGREHAHVQVDVLRPLGGLPAAQGDIEPTDALEGRPDHRIVRSRTVGADLEGEQRQLRWWRGNRVHAGFPRVGPGHAMIEPGLRTGADLAAGDQPANQPHAGIAPKTAGDPRQPVAIHHHVVVNEGDVLVGGHPHPTVTALGNTKDRLVDVANPGIGVTEGDVAGLGGGPSVINHDDLEVRVVAGQNGVDRGAKQLPTVAGADHHADRRPNRFRLGIGGRKFVDGPPQLIDKNASPFHGHHDETAQGLTLAHQETGPAVARPAGQSKCRTRCRRCQVAKIKFTDPYCTGPLGVVAAVHRMFQHDVTLPEGPQPTARTTRHSA